MTTMTSLRTLVPLLLLALPLPAVAGTVKGTVRVPDTVRSGRMNQGYWRLENGNEPVRPSSRKAGTVVVLQGISGTHTPPPRTVTVEIAGLTATPRIVVVGTGTVVEIKNTSKNTHQ